jgi:hypothetical protein
MAEQHGGRDIEATLQDIYDALMGIGVELEALVEIERARAMYELGFDPLHGTSYEGGVEASKEG